MRKIAALLLLVALTGCSTAPSDRVPDGLWYAESEIPDQFHYHVYVLFLDDSHFTWWRVDEAPDTVIKRLAHYTNDHPGVKILTSYTREGDRITGERRFIHEGTPSLKGFTSVQIFTGHFSGDTLEMKVEGNMIYDDGRSFPAQIIRWPLKRLSDSAGG
ncbi:hypothetical protein HU762_17600 [Pseudomonas sp. SWRI92]|uniref:Lipoprotein n=1 Tax=Pseudomonas marvdashtae TaxID=2745500 RepID=A0A923FLP8_9PSED|nr:MULTISPECIES: hypothetical protein [Pseudomonas]MBC3375768.1 hypothetical protein [Pseudomonas sp. SWRI92]MBV4552308.1 hypothetical protein [Pseudomonas marvdashtae]